MHPHRRILSKFNFTKPLIEEDKQISQTILAPEGAGKGGGKRGGRGAQGALDFFIGNRNLVKNDQVKKSSSGKK